MFWSERQAREFGIRLDRLPRNENDWATFFANRHRQIRQAKNAVKSVSGVSR